MPPGDFCFMESYLEFKSVSKNFPGVVALDDVSLQIKEGVFMALSVKTERGSQHY